MKPLLEIVGRHKAGQPVGVYSLCSAHPLVIETAMREAQATSTPLLIEATCNQVNQFGGYTGMTPAAFREFVHGIAERQSFPHPRLWLGGDHLGPNAWRQKPAAVAIKDAEELVAQCVAAGFRKLHLDCSMTCADDPQSLPEETIAARAAHLGAVAERAWRTHGGEAPVYVIGTEVPVPGGANEELETIAVTKPEAVATTIALHRRAFLEADLAPAWSRVIALVVQPGVEFDHDKVVDYQPGAARALSAFVENDPQFVFEAHSTDYQTPENLRALVRDHFAILKVGPAATFAMRQTLWALATIAAELPGEPIADLRDVVIGAMRADPGHWRGHYRDEESQSLNLAHSLSDRIRYYWPRPDVQRAYHALLARLRRESMPLTLLSQYLPRQYESIRAGQLDANVDAVLSDGIASSLRPYIRACYA